jgi:hypothetical protein
VPHSGYAQNTSGTTIDGVLAALTDLIAEMRAASASGSSFRRLADPYLVPCELEASKKPVDRVWLEQKGVTSFAVTNPNPFWVRLRGSNTTPGFKAVEEHTGWLFPPGIHAIYATQYPDFMSAMAVEKPGFPITDGDGAFLYPGATIEVAYGTGA